VKMLNVDVTKQEDIVTPIVKLKDYFHENGMLIVKNRWNAFFNTNLDELLKSKNIKNLIITGAATDVCVLETCSYAFSLNYNCIVPIETTASFNAERKKIGLEILGFGRSKVVNAEEVYKMVE